MKKIEHIGIAVKDLEEAEKRFARLLQVEPYKRETVASEQVTTSFFQAGDAKIELLASTSPGGVIDKFIEKRGEGIHHIAFATADIEAEIRRLKAEGFELINDRPKKGADNKWVIFVHPRSTGGILVEFCQEIHKD